MINRLSILAIFSLALAAPSYAAVPMTVGGVYNTGVNPYTSNPLAAGANDLLFNLYAFSPQPLTGTPVVVPTSQTGPGWFTAGAAQWIAPVENQSGAPNTGSPAGTYDYQGSFSSDFLVATQVTVTGAFASDNSAALYINGAFVTSTPGFGGSAGNGFNMLTPINFTFTAPAGMYIVPVQFDVDNTAASYTITTDSTSNSANTSASAATNPTGLLVTNLTYTAGNSAPEPSTWALLGGGLLALVLVGRRRMALLQ